MTCFSTEFDRSLAAEARLEMYKIKNYSQLKHSQRKSNSIKKDRKSIFLAFSGAVFTTTDGSFPNIASKDDLMLSYQSKKNTKNNITETIWSNVSTFGKMLKVLSDISESTLLPFVSILNQDLNREKKCIQVHKKRIQLKSFTITTG